MNWTNSGLTYGLRLVGLNPPEKTHARPEQGWNGTPSSLEKTTRESGRGGGCYLSLARRRFRSAPRRESSGTILSVDTAPSPPLRRRKQATCLPSFLYPGRGGGQARLDQNLRNLRRLLRRKEVSGKLVRNNVSLSGRSLPRFF